MSRRPHHGARVVRGSQSPARETEGSPTQGASGQNNPEEPSLRGRRHTHNQSREESGRVDPIAGHRRLIDRNDEGVALLGGIC